MQCPSLLCPAALARLTTLHLSCAGSAFLDLSRNATWHFYADLTITLRPVTWYDQDLVGAPSPLPCLPVVFSSPCLQLPPPRLSLHHSHYATKKREEDGNLIDMRLACACAVIYDQFMGYTPPTQVYNQYETKTTQSCNLATKGCCNSGTTLTQLVQDTSTQYDCWVNWVYQTFSVQVGSLH